MQSHAYYAGPPGNGTPSESQLLDAYYAEARRLIDAPDEVRNSKPVFVYPGVLQNFIRAYEQSVFSDDRTQKLNYAKAVCCLRLITVVKVGLQVFANVIHMYCTLDNWLHIYIYNTSVHII